MRTMLGSFRTVRKGCEFMYTESEKSSHMYIYGTKSTILFLLREQTIVGKGRRGGEDEEEGEI